MFLGRLAFGPNPLGALELGRLAKGAKPGSMVPTIITLLNIEMPLVLILSGMMKDRLLLL